MKKFQFIKKFTDSRYKILSIILLIIAGASGNYMNFPVFMDINFIFGSIFAMLVIQFFGLSIGIPAAALISAYTFILWNHPYAVIIMTSEAAVVGLLMRFRRMGMVNADTLYWIFIGMPLVYFFYHIIMQTPSSNTMIVMTKQAVNGITNALIARLIFMFFNLKRRSSVIETREIISNILALFVLLPALLLLGFSSRKDFTTTDTQIRTTLIQNSSQLTNSIQQWVANRKSAVINLSEAASVSSLNQMQSYIEMAKKSDKNFLRVGLLDKNATITAYYPLIDELGKNNIGKNFADRPFIPTLKRTLSPMLSEVVMGRIGTPKPMVTMLAPVVINKEYAGYITGILSLDEIRENLEKSSNHNSMLFTLLDKNGKVIMTNRKDQITMKLFERGKGTIVNLENEISQWVPVLKDNISIMERWRKSFYIAESGIGNISEWKLVLEQPVEPFQKILYDQYSGKLILLFLILTGSLALAEFISRQSIITLEKLTLITSDMPARLSAGEEKTIWPESGIAEVKDLISNYRDMADTLSEQFNRIQMINESLEKRVDERTRELTEERKRLAGILEGTNVGTWEWNIQTGETIFNRRWAEIIGYTLEEISPVSIDTWTKFAHPDDLKISGELLEKHFRGELDYYEFESRMKHKNGKWVWVLDRGKVTLRDNDKPLMIMGTHQDITVRKEAEEKIKSLLAEKEIILKEVHHRVKNNMNTIYGLLILQSNSLDNNASPGAALEDAARRVQSMMVLYSKLYQSPDFQKISVIDYLPSLVDEIFINFPNTRLIELEKKISDFVLDAKRLMPLGIIINELLTNTMKYAFTGRDNGRINVIAELIPLPGDEGGLVSVQIHDNGNGIPESINFESSTGFGLQLVSMLTHELQGKIRIERGNGTKFILEFKK